MAQAGPEKENFVTPPPPQKKREKHGGDMLKCLLTEFNRLGWTEKFNIWHLVSNNQATLTY